MSRPVSSPGLEMIVPVVISTDLKAGSNEEPASNTKDLTTFEIPNSTKVLGHT